MSGSSIEVLPPIQRLVTGHNEDGRACFVSEDVSEPERIASGDANFLLMWTSATVPADKPCRIAFVLIEASAFLHEGQPLPEHLP